MLGVLVNVATVIVGSVVGLLFKKGLPERLTALLMSGVGLCVVYIGIDGSLQGENTLVLVISIALGAVIGGLIGIDKWLNRGGDWLTKKFKNGKFGNAGEGFVSGTLLFCVGAMTIVGSLDAGLTGNNETLFIKALLDLISAMVLTVTLGGGVMLSAVSVFVLQGGIVLLSGLLQPLLNAHTIAEITCVGSVIILGLGMNLLGITKIKVADLLPAIFIAPILCLFM